MIKAHFIKMKKAVNVFKLELCLGYFYVNNIRYDFVQKDLRFFKTRKLWTKCLKLNISC